MTIARDPFLVGGGVLAVIGAWSAWTALAPLPAPEPGPGVAVSEPSAKASDDPRATRPDPTAIARSLRRPLFSPDRRPAVVRAAQAPTPAQNQAQTAAAADIVLAGVTVIDGEARAALSVGGGPAQSYAQGDPVAGWRVDAIALDAVALRRGAEQLRLSLTAETAETVAEPETVSEAPKPEDRRTARRRRNNGEDEDD
ncbi:MAG: hypothetical protein ACFB2Z_13595 [Maricaulaceae bacterium]